MKIIENGLYSYPKGRGHCKHGLVVIFKDTDGEFYAKDTYWTTGGATYKVEAIKDDITFLLDLNNAIEVSQSEYYLYDESDRAYIPVGGWHDKRLVRADATKRTDYIIEDLKYRIEENYRKIRSLKIENERLEIELSQYQ